MTVRNKGFPALAMFFFTVRLVKFLALLIPTQAGVNTTTEHGSGYNFAMLPFEEVARLGNLSGPALLSFSTKSFFLFSIFRVISPRYIFYLFGVT